MDEMPMISTLTMGQVKVKSEHPNTKFERKNQPSYPHTHSKAHHTWQLQRLRWDETAKDCPSWQFCSVLVLRSRKKKSQVAQSAKCNLERGSRVRSNSRRQHAEIGGRRDSADQCFGPGCNPTNMSKSRPLIRLPTMCRCEGRRPRGVDILQGPLAESLTMRDWVWWIRMMGLNGVN